MADRWVVGEKADVTATPMAGDLVAKALPAIRAREHASSIRRVG